MTHKPKVWTVEEIMALKDEPKTFRYVFINTNYLYQQIKNVLKDEQYGKMTREDCALALRALADKVEAKEVGEEQLSFPELQEHLSQHLSRNRRGNYKP